MTYPSISSPSFNKTYLFIRAAHRARVIIIHCSSTHKINEPFQRGAESYLVTLYVWHLSAPPNYQTSIPASIRAHTPGWNLIFSIFCLSSYFSASIRIPNSAMLETTECAVRAHSANRVTNGLFRLHSEHFIYRAPLRWPNTPPNKTRCRLA